MISCLFCDRRSPTMIPKGWDWFTGHFDHTAHFCPMCQREHARKIQWLYRRALIEPVPPHRATSLDATLRELQTREDSS